MRKSTSKKLEKDYQKIVGKNTLFFNSSPAKPGQMIEKFSLLKYYPSTTATNTDVASDSSLSFLDKKNELNA
ncbi:MAG: hypothetical protein KDC34_19110 [Saprospiraceae bacterium]|nr:hypothetical protein [Saprospiraceae bacterium]